MSGAERDGLDRELVEWNDRMYRAHGTPYDRGITKRIQDARVATVMRLAAITPADSVLELGCEAGGLLCRVPDCRRLVGADVSSAALADARERFQGLGRDVELVQVDAQRPLPFASGEFDVVICSEMLEHLADPGAAVAQIRAVCGPATRVVLTVPIEAPKVVVKRVLSAVGLLGLLFPGVEPGQSEWHLQSFSRRRLLALTADGLDHEAGNFVWGCHYVARFRAR